MAVVTGLHVLIDPDRIPASRLPAFIREVADAGASVIQVRAKAASTRSALAYLTAAKRAMNGALTLVVNDRVDWALAVDADGVHLGQDDLPLDIARRLGPHLILGASVGNRVELDRVLPERPDYLGVGPIFATPSKADAGAPIGVEGLRALMADVPPGMPVIAIGGITPDNAGAVWAVGVQGLAVIHAVVGAQDPGRAVAALLEGRGGRG